MFRLLLVIALVAQSSLAKPTNCMLFCDEQSQMGGYVQAPVQTGQYRQVPVQMAPVAQAPVQAPYSVYNGFGRPTYTSAAVQNPDVSFVQPGNYATMPVSYGPSRMSQAQVQPTPTQSGGFEAMFHNSASQSSQSSMSSMGYVRQYPTINTVHVQQEPLRTRPSAKLCVNEYVNPCY